MVGFELEGPAQRRLVAGGDELVGFGRRRGQAGDEGGHLWLGKGADEVVDDLAVAHGEDGRDGLDLEGRRHPGVVVDVDLHELDGAVGCFDHLLENGAEGAARAAPRGPEVDDDGNLDRPVENVLLEGGIGDIDHSRSRQ